ncbi:hypothetical protein ACSYAY_01330 [Leptospirillum ferriphilum]|uniref:Lipoprotein n=1 Tax=Leptospirillum ferriphilum TaxID=178606 RepID=A0A1V3SV63_9BACT|nr:hypothetical protein [Leptospirillum ferriphilum]OOH72753.1 hypothetical protein BOX24_05030 [Leptospirillum ferriphilum]
MRSDKGLAVGVGSMMLLLSACSAQPSEGDIRSSVLKWTIAQTDNAAAFFSGLTPEKKRQIAKAVDKDKISKTGCARNRTGLGYDCTFDMSGPTPAGIRLFHMSGIFEKDSKGQWFVHDVKTLN